MPAHTPEELHVVLEDAFRRGDLDAYAAAYEDDATLVQPPDGRLLHGRAQIRAAAEPIFAGRPQLTSVVSRAVRGNGFALTHARWGLVSTAPDGTRSTLNGRATLVSRRRPDGTWGIVLDDPLSPM